MSDFRRFCGSHKIHAVWSLGSILGTLVAMTGIFYSFGLIPLASRAEVQREFDRTRAVVMSDNVVLENRLILIHGQIQETNQRLDAILFQMAKSGR